MLVNGDVGCVESIWSLHGHMSDPSSPTWAIWPSWPLYRTAVNRGNGVPWITPMRLAPPQIRMPMLTYVTKDHDHQRAWLGSTGIPSNHIPPFGARAEQASPSDESTSFSTDFRPITKRTRIYVVFSTGNPKPTRKLGG